MTASCDIIRLRARNIAKPGRSSLFSHVTVGILCPLSFLWSAYASPFHITFAPHERFNRLGPGARYLIRVRNIRRCKGSFFSHVPGRNEVDMRLGGSQTELVHTEDPEPTLRSIMRSD